MLGISGPARVTVALQAAHVAAERPVSAYEAKSRERTGGHVSGRPDDDDAGWRDRPTEPLAESSRELAPRCGRIRWLVLSLFLGDGVETRRGVRVGGCDLSVLGCTGIELMYRFVE